MAKTIQTLATIAPNKLKDLISVFNSLSKINEIIRLKKEDDTLLLYSLIGPDNSVHAFKYYCLNFNDFFKDTQLKEFDLILSDVKKLTKQLQFYLDYENDIEFTFYTQDGTDLGSSQYLVRQLYITNRVFESFVIADEPFLIRNLSMSSIKERVSPDLRKFGFQMSADNFLKIKKLINLDTTSDIIELNIEEGVIKFKEKKWSLDIGKTTLPNEKIAFKKKYLSNAEEIDNMKIDIFDTFLVMRGEISDLMITLELAEY